jgi:hypothetical protein
VPSFYQVAAPLASFGLSADNNGRIFDTVSPFANADESPAAAAGLLHGDRLDLGRMRCTNPLSPNCVSLVAVLGGLGGLQYVRPGSRITLSVVPRHGGPTHTVRLAASLAPLSVAARLVLLADTVVGVLFIAVAFHLVWTRPGRMTWGFFLYAIWFNPGQDYAFYALIQPWPLAVLAEQFVEALAQGAAYAGLLAFALRFPTGVPEPAGRRLEPTLPWLGAAITACTLFAGANLFGLPTGHIAKAVFLFGFLLDAAVIAVLVLRLRRLPPQDEQRMRWAIAGCAIGLPAFIFAELCQSSGLPHDLFGVAPSQAVIGLLYLCHGVIAYFVGTAVRRRRVVSVTIPLRRGAILTALTLALGVPILNLHQRLAAVYGESVYLPEWFWAVVIGPIALLVLTRLHELSVDIAERAFNRRYHRIRLRLESAGEGMGQAKDFATIDRLLVEVPAEGMRLSSAAVFRWMDGALRRVEPAIGWPVDGLAVLDHKQDARLLANLPQGTPLRLARGGWQRPGLPGDDQAPCLAVPVCGGATEGKAIALFGPHLTGSDITADERELLRIFAGRAALAYDKVEIDTLRREVSALSAALAAREATAQTACEAAGADHVPRDSGMISGLLPDGRARPSQDECRYKLIEGQRRPKVCVPLTKVCCGAFLTAPVARNERLPRVEPPLFWGRSFHRTQSGRSALAARTALDAPFQPFVDATLIRTEAMERGPSV